MVDITKLMTSGTAMYADLVRELLHQEFDGDGQRRIRANLLRSNPVELREKVFIALRSAVDDDVLSDNEVWQAVDEFLEVVRERPA